MTRWHHAPLFKGRHFPDDVIVSALWWYLRYSLSYRNVVEMLALRGIAIAHTTLWRWVDRYGPELDRRLRQHLRPTGTQWRADETYIRAAGQWVYLFPWRLRSAAPLRGRSGVSGRCRDPLRARVDTDRIEIIMSREGYQLEAGAGAIQQREDVDRDHYRPRA